MKNKNKLVWLQYGRRHNLAAPLGLSEIFDINAHVAYSKNIFESDKIKLFYHKLQHFLPTALNRVGFKIEIDLASNIFIQNFHGSVYNRYKKANCVFYTLSNGYPLSELKENKTGVHEQVSCTLDYAKLLNQYQNRRLDLEGIYNREKSVFSKMQLIICPSEHVRMYVKGIHASAQTLVIPYPMFQNNRISRSNHKINRKKIKVIFVGRVEKLKGHETVKFLAKEFPNVDFTLVGHILDEPSKLTNMKYLGHLPSAEVLKALNSSDLFLFPSFSEGSSLACQEALSMGIPGLVSHQSGSHYRDNVTGLLADAFQVTEFSNCLEKISNNPDILIEMMDNIKNPSMNACMNYNISTYQQSLREALCNSRLF